MMISMDFKKRMSKKTQDTFWRTIIVDTIFILENFGIIIFVVLHPPNDTHPGQNGEKDQIQTKNGIQTWIFILIAVGHMFGLLLKYIYYALFHIWKDSLSGKDLIRRLKGEETKKE